MQRSLRPTAALTLVAFLSSMTLACSGAPTVDDEAADDSEAITADQAKPPEAVALVTNVSAVKEVVTGARSWSLYSMQAADVGNKKHSSFDGLIAYGIDRNDQVVWSIVIDNAHPEKKGVQRLNSAGKMIASTITPELAAAFDAELTNVRDVIAKQKAAARTSSPPSEPYRAPRSPIPALSAIVVGGGATLGYLALGGAGVALGVLFAIPVLLMVVVLYIEAND